MRRVAILGVIVVLLVPALAQAAPFTPKLNLAYALGMKYWGGGQPPLCTSVDKQIVPAGVLAGGAGAAVATQPDVPIPCVIYFAQDTLASDFSATCQVAVHEVGHLFGHSHSADPHNVMYRQLGYPYLPICKRAGLLLDVLAYRHSVLSYKRRSCRRWPAVHCDQWIRRTEHNIRTVRATFWSLPDA